MTKLKDKGFRIWVSTFVLILILFVFPAEFIVKLVNVPEVGVLFVRSITVLVSLGLAIWAHSRYRDHAMHSANDAARYTTVDECNEDIKNDNATHQLLLSISWAYVSIGVTGLIVAFSLMTIFGMNFLTVLKSNVSPDWGIGYFVLAVFNFKMTKIRGKERDLTIENSLLSMERKPLAMVQPTA